MIKWILKDVADHNYCFKTNLAIFVVIHCSFAHHWALLDELFCSWKSFSENTVEFFSYFSLSNRENLLIPVEHLVTALFVQ